MIELRINCYGGDHGELNIHAGILDEEIFRRGYQALSASTLQITKFKTTQIEGTINCNKSGILYTSIPQNGNWIAKVDGQPAEVIAIGNAVVGLLLSEGEHTIAFHYQNKAFTWGVLTSICCLGIFVALSTISLLREKRKQRNNKTSW